jgi:hypothetical protein
VVDNNAMGLPWGLGGSSRDRDIFLLLVMVLIQWRRSKDILTSSDGGNARSRYVHIIYYVAFRAIYTSYITSLIAGHQLLFHQWHRIAHNVRSWL